MNFLNSKKIEVKNFFNKSQDRHIEDFQIFLADFFYDIIMNSHIKNKSSNKVEKSDYNILKGMFESFYDESRKTPFSREEYISLGKNIVEKYLKSIVFNNSPVEFEGVDTPNKGVVIEKYGNGEGIGLNLYYTFNLNKEEMKDRKIASEELSKRLINVAEYILDNMSGYYSGTNASSGVSMAIPWDGLSVI